MGYECCAGGTTYNDLPAAVDLEGGVLSPPADPGQSPGGGRGGEKPLSFRDPAAYISQKMPKIHPRDPFTLNYDFVD